MTQPGPPVEIDPTLRLVPAQGTAAGPLGEEMVVLDLGDGAYYRLSAVAASAWQLFDGRRSIQDVALAIAGAYEVDHQTATTDLLMLALELARAGLVTVADPEP